MGLGDILGGGSQESKIELPDYIRNPAGRIGQTIEGTFRRRGPVLNQQQQDALGGIEGTARGGNPLLPQSQDFLSRLFGGGGLTGEQSNLAGQLTGGGFVNPAAAGYANVAGGGLRNPALDEARRVATGGDVGRNPYLEDTYNRAANVVSQQFRENAVPGMDRAFLSQGRLGSNAYANARNRTEDSYGRNLNDLATTVFGGAYEQDRNRQQQALGLYGQLGQAGIDTRLQGLAGQANLGQQDVANRIAGSDIYGQGTNNLFGATSTLPQLQELRYDDLNRLFGAGTTRQDARYAEINRAGQALRGLPYGQTQTTSNNVNPLVQGIGLATGIAGAAAPYYMYSDARLKRDVVRIGMTPAGLPVYRFRYVWGDDEHIGVLAQEARELFPAAVIDLGGWLAVDYSRIA